MKTATARQLRNEFPKVLRAIRNGETVAILSRNEVVATLSPPPMRVPRRRKPWANLDARMERIEARQKPAESGAQMIAEDRDRY